MAWVQLLQISGSEHSLYLCTPFHHPPAPKVERLDDTSCEVTWEALSPMKGDPVIYTLQCMMGNSEFKQVLMLLCEASALPFHVFCPSLVVCHWPALHHSGLFMQMRIQMNCLYVLYEFTVLCISDISSLPAHSSLWVASSHVNME